MTRTNDNINIRANETRKGEISWGPHLDKVQATSEYRERKN